MKFVGTRFLCRCQHRHFRKVVYFLAQDDSLLRTGIELAEKTKVHGPVIRSMPAGS